MADFNKAFEKTQSIEGGYVNDPSDAGGETWRGISRRFHPSWAGWAIIDMEKRAGLEGLNERLAGNRLLDEVERQFYREQFWNRINGDAIPLQSIADEVYDTAVNVGVHRAVGFLQGALNLLNRDEKNYPDILEDGACGPKTLYTLREHLAHEKGDPTILLKVMNTLQGMHYVDVMRRFPEQERYARGWFRRA